MARLNPPAADGLVAGWIAESGAVKDVVADSTTPLATGVTIVQTGYGDTFDFAGAGQVKLTAINLTDPCTIFGLVRHGAPSGGLPVNRSVTDGIGFQVTDSTALAMGNVQGELFGNLIPVSLGPTEWYSLAMVINRGKGLIYVNAQITTRFDATWVEAGDVWQLGDGEFTGQVADARLYDKALNGVDIKRIQEGTSQWAAYSGLLPPDTPAPAPDGDGANLRRIEGGGRRASTFKVKAARRIG